MSNRGQRVFLNMILLAGSLVFCALALEGAVRVGNWWHQWWDTRRTLQPKCVMSDPVIGFQLKPSFAGRRASSGEYDVIERTNKSGLREDREYGPKPKGTFRILAIGDSFTYGWGVELQDTFERQLEHLLNERLTDRRYEVVNAGVPSYGTVQEFQWLKRIGPSLDPDLILIGLYIGDDLKQNAMYASTMAQKTGTEARLASDSDQLMPPPVRDYHVRLPIPLKGLLAEYSMGYRFLRERYDRLLTTIHIRQKQPDAEPWWLISYRKDLVPEHELGYTYTDTLLSQIAQWAAEHHTGILVMLIPDRSQVYPEYWTKTIRDRITFDRTRYDLEKPNRWFVAFGERAALPILDLLPRFQDRSRQVLLYYNWDHHWTREGHRLVAEELFHRLIEQRVLLRQLLVDGS